jgi:hypothetical protein
MASIRPGMYMRRFKKCCSVYLPETIRDPNDFTKLTHPPLHHTTPCTTNLRRSKCLPTPLPRLRHAFKDTRKRLRMDDSAFPLEEESPKSRSKKSSSADLAPAAPLAQHNSNTDQSSIVPEVVDVAPATEAAVAPRAPSPAPVTSSPAATAVAAAPTAEDAAMDTTALDDAATVPSESQEAHSLQPLLDAARAKVDAMSYKDLQKDLKVRRQNPSPHQPPGPQSTPLL